MAEGLTVYQMAVTTDRRAGMLAQRHGFKNVAQLAGSLAPGANVLDVGAGASPFGIEVAALRPDITWVNFDYSYQDPAILEEVTQNAPANVKHIAGDATKLDTRYEPGGFDAVFSYWLLPHLSLDDPEPAKQAARAIFAVAKTGSLMSIGPKASRMPWPSLKSGPAIQTIKQEGLDAESYAEHIATETKLRGATRYVQKLANEVATPFFGTTRYAKREGRIPTLYHPESGAYVSPFTRKGAHTIGRLTVALVQHAASQGKSPKQ